MGMACSSCHDPHGRYRQDSTGAISGGASGTPATLPIAESGSYPITAFPAGAAIGVYRLLGGVGYIPKSLTDAGGDAGLAFTNPSPIAVAPKTYNQNEVTGQTNTGTTGAAKYYGGSTMTVATAGEVRVAYGSGMSEWCANCHTYMLNSAADASSTHRHPVGAAAKMTNVAANYNSYLGSGNMTGVNAYTSLVPFEEGTDNYTDIIDLGTRAGDTAPINGTAGVGGGIVASSTTNVMCLSCHRAHATAFPQDGRWDFNDELMVEDGAYNGNVGGYGTAGAYTDAQYAAAMYGRTADMFATYQRSLCNKCHAKD
jgi:hypothetical protein